jgi:hypothetical protein
MTSSPRQHFRLFRVFGITVFLHWSWFLVAAYQLDQRSGRYSSLGWSVAEYLALFGIVLLHEFGHALACRQVGGTAEEIVLWPLGGVAYVAPPAASGGDFVEHCRRAAGQRGAGRGVVGRDVGNRFCGTGGAVSRRMVLAASHRVY